MIDEELWRARAQELLDAEEANRLGGPTVDNQARLARARRELEELVVGSRQGAGGGA